MLEIELYYNEVENDIKKLNKIALGNCAGIDDELQVALIINELLNVYKKAKLYDILQHKRSEGGKKSWQNMTEKERTERARKAGKAKKKI